MDIFDKLFDFEYKNNTGLVNLTGEFFALYLKRIFNREKRGILVVTPSLYEANNLVNSFGYNEDVLLFEVDDVLTENAIASSPDVLVNRLGVINELISNNKKIVVTDVNGFLKFLPSRKSYLNSIINLKVGTQIDPKELVNKLFDLGYVKDTIVTRTGDLGVRGFVVDVFLVEEENPIRIEFFGDEIDSIKYFDCESQKSIGSINSIDVKPFSDKLLVDSFSSIFDYLDNPIVVYKDYSQLRVVYNRMVDDVYNYFNTDKKCFFEFDEVNVLDSLYYFDLDNDISGLSLDDVISFDVRPVDKLNEDIDKINKYLKDLVSSGKTPILFLPNTDIIKFSSYLTSNFVTSDIFNIINGVINIVKDDLYRGFIYGNYVFLTEYDLFNRKIVRKSRTKFKYASRIKDISKLEIGDYVVHSSHGIGVYNGIKTLNKKDIVKDYIEVLYAKGDKLYIPVSKIELLSKYSGKEGYEPKINSLNSTAWAKTKQRVREKIKYEAARLIKVQALRELKKGFAFSKDSVMQEMFESKFIYDETVDQINVTKEIKKDMESIVPMDRILCGDVGYGKTEVAFRAMFKAVMDSKQVLYICPTTLLSKQQYDSAVERFKDFPVNIALLNRFTSTKDTNRVLKDLKSGLVDIVIGTHRLLSDDIKPKDLGLLVIDEEQRFGVAHKEKIKEFKSNVDVLTLTATPIPRTLQMAMLGLKNLSLIETPPKNRHPVQTYVTPYDKKVLKDIIYKEISRNGQVFVLYNYVSDIERVKSEIERLVPDASVVIAHGQMDKKELEDKINSFINGEFNVLLCTTIIETGIDIPNANSLVVLNADRFGLSQLYQIRGRVGRSDRIAYAYLMYDKNKVLTETAIKRLQVIKEFTELGSGFHIAARDLSIRGAGDILGSEQAGFIDTVGIDLYMKMLNDEIAILKGYEVENDEDVSDKSLVDVSTHIKDSYVESEDLKILIHKLINTIDTRDKLNEVKIELEDRFGKIDNDILVYMHEELFENLIKNLGVKQVLDNNNYIEIEFSKEKSDVISYEDLFVESIKICNKFKFTYKNNRLYIKLEKKSLDNHPIIIFNELLEKI